MTRIRRRDLARVAAAAAVATLAAVPAAPSDEKAVREAKRRPQYQPDSPEVQTFYRVNRYPMK
jgi:hypothetical protein